MPGIAGFVDLSRSHGLDIHHMLKQIKYRDSYIVDHYEGEWFALGRADLPTLNPDHQPSTKKGLVVFFQGNIVNKNDVVPSSSVHWSNADIVAELYSEIGTDLVKQIKGNFAAAIWDPTADRVVVLNDRFGRHQVYLWSPDPKTLLFASEMKCILPFVKNGLLPNLQAIADFLQYQFVFGDNTYFEGIKLLPEASILQFDKNGLAVKKYWVPKPSPSVSPETSSKYESRLHSLMSRAVSRAIEGRTAGVLLSGGLDSRNISVHLPTRKERTHSFTIEGLDEEDVKLAESLSKEEGFQFHLIPLTPRYVREFADLSSWITEGNGTLHWTHNMVMLDEIERSGVEVILEGSSSGPLFKLPLPFSLPTFALLSLPVVDRFVLKLIPKIRAKSKLFEQIRAHFMSITLSEAQVNDILSEEFRARVGPLGESFRRIVYDASEYSRSIFDVAYSLMITQYIRRGLIAIPNCCRWRVEVVDPFLDYDFVDFMMELPYKYKLWRRLAIDEISRFHGRETPLHDAVYPTSLDNFRSFGFMVAKRIPVLRKRVSRETPRGLGRLPEFAREHRDYIESVLFSPHAMSRGLFDLERVRFLFNEHMRSESDHGLLIYRLLCLELWFRSVENAYKVRIIGC